MNLLWLRVLAIGYDLCAWNWTSGARRREQPRTKRSVKDEFGDSPTTLLATKLTIPAGVITQSRRRKRTVGGEHQLVAPAVNHKRILCIEESIWEEKRGLTSRTTTVPMLELLERMDAIDEFVHRHAVGVTEFENYLTWRTLGRARTRSYGVLYLAFHGSRHGLQIGERTVSLDELANLIGPFPGGVVHLSSCSVLKDGDAAARRLLAKTGARMISGYERNVEWLESAALDTAWLGYLAYYKRIGDAERHFRNRFGSLSDYLKWEAISA